MKLVSGKTGLMLRLGVLVTAMLFAQQALAEGTRAGTSIINTATVDFDVAGVVQTQLSSLPVEFVVDRRVDFILVAQGAALVPVTPGGNDYFLDFLLTNTSNSVLDFNVALAQMVGGLVRPAQTDDADMATVDYAVSANSVANGDTDPVRLGPQFVDELEADDAIRIRVFGDAGLAMTNGQIAGVELTLNGADGGAAAVEGAPLVDGVPNTDLGVENVFADAGNDNSEVDRDGFIVVSADLAVTKAYIVFAGDLGSGLPIPGATIEYTITIVNSSTTTAADPVQIGDVLDGDVSFVTGGFSGLDFEIDNGGVVSQCTAVADADDCVEAAGVITIGAAGTISLAASTTLTLTYQVLILDPATTP
ncbi:MAG: hypothetical protein IID59_09900 [Proteobacteria bacterium]|nr:hypothetical protein [Pseudomonadota bacterium]